MRDLRFALKLVENLFTMLRTDPVLGRQIGPADEAPVRRGTAVMGSADGADEGRSDLTSRVPGKRSFGSSPGRFLQA